MQGSTEVVTAVGSPMTPFEHLETAAYLALGLTEPDITYDGFMTAAEAAWINVAGAQR